jgi:predicted RNA-binding Zn ribbon-like protein
MLTPVALPVKSEWWLPFGMGWAILRLVTSDEPINSEAPGELELVRQLMNSLDIEEGTDTLASAAAATAWLASHGSSGRVTRGEVDELVDLREGLRDLTDVHGVPQGSDAVAVVDRIARRHPLAVRVSSSTPLAPTSAGAADAFIEQILGIVAAARIDGSWERLKTCANDECRWAYYDHSRNRSRTWCTMESCGSQAKMRAYRARRATTAR